MSSLDNTSKLAKRRPRPPPRLRTKTGCFKCRERRKKCDEVKPVCSACHHLKLDCVYPAGGSATRSLSPRVSASPSPVESIDETIELPPTRLSPSLALQPRSIHTQQEWNLFQYGSILYNPLLLRPDAPSRYRDFSYVFSVSLDIPWLMRAVLAPAAIHASWRSIVPKETAISYSQSALTGLKDLVRQQTATSEVNDTLLIACIFLGVFEDFYSAPSSHTLVHYMACARLLEKKLATEPVQDFDQISPFYRTAIESTLYHFSTRLIFEPKVEDICKAFPWQVVTKYCQWFEQEYQVRDVKEMVLPVLGRGSPALFLLIFQVIWLSRQFPFDAQSADHRQALECQEELRRIEKLISPNVSSFIMLTNEHREGFLSGDSEIAAALYIIGLKIYITKMIDPVHVTSDESSIQLLLSEAYKLLTCWDPTAPCSQYICWPVLILGCAACPRDPAEVQPNAHLTDSGTMRSRMRSLIRDKLLLIWRSTFSGYVRRSASVLEEVWSHRHASDIVNDIPHHEMGYERANDVVNYDGLDVLLVKRGLAPRHSSESDLFFT